MHLHNNINSKRFSISIRLVRIVARCKSILRNSNEHKKYRNEQRRDFRPIQKVEPRSDRFQARQQMWEMQQRRKKR